jgi:uncharacterized protein (UPF0261 family)/ABC-type branched-subunit amino acid transport system ATPase component
MARSPFTATDAPILEVGDLDVYYGRAHALQGVTLTLPRGVLAVVGRNGMGKTTLCNAIMGLVPARGSVKLAGEEILGLPPNRISDKGIGYVPQGRRVWPSLTVDEHLRLTSRSGNQGAWTVSRIYQTFPRLAERKGNGGSQLSGGEQQMLAIARALLLNPRLLVMDEPTEGLAPVIVEQVEAMLSHLAHEGDVSVLLIEQNLGVALAVADNVGVMINGRIARVMPAAELAADPDLQQRLLGVKSSGEEEEAAPEAAELAEQAVQVFTVRRAGDEGVAPPVSPTEAPRTVRGFTRWNTSDPGAQPTEHELRRSEARPAEPPARAELESLASVATLAASTGSVAYVAGTFDTKGRELMFLRSCLDRLRLRTVTVDLSTAGKPSPASVSPSEVARHHPKGSHAVFSNDRGASVEAMSRAFERFILTRRDLGGLISAGGSGGTALATAAMRRLPIGVPKVMVSTVASSDVKPYVGPSDICMMYSVTDVSGINRISERVLSNAAHALAGMMLNAGRDNGRTQSKPAIGLTMFGVTTPCVQAVAKALEDRYDCITFHATGTGGQSMEKLVESGLLSAVLDITTTEVADELMGGVFSAGPERFESVIRSRVPYVGSCGALDMVNFHAWDTVPAQFKGRNLYRHNQNVTLMRTTPEECTRMGEWIAAKLNRMEGPVRFLVPEGGVSLLDAPGKAFWDPDADKALFAAIERNFRNNAGRKLVKVPYNINDAGFVDALLKQFREVEPKGEGAKQPSASAR